MVFRKLAVAVFFFGVSLIGGGCSVVPPCSSEQDESCSKPEVKTNDEIRNSQVLLAHSKINLLQNRLDDIKAEMFIFFVSLEALEKSRQTLEVRITWWRTIRHETESEQHPKVLQPDRKISELQKRLDDIQTEIFNIYLNLQALEKNSQTFEARIAWWQSVLKKNLEP